MKTLGNLTLGLLTIFYNDLDTMTLAAKLYEPRTVQAMWASVPQTPDITKCWEPGLKWERQGKAGRVQIH